jgi:hypothetical protein
MAIKLEKVTKLTTACTKEMGRTSLAMSEGVWAKFLRS